jgi:hypothetical protein
VGIIQKRFALRSKRLKFLQHITPTEKVLRFEFWANMTDRIAKDATFLSKSVPAKKKHFIFVRRSGDLISAYGDANIVTLWLDM